MHISMMVYRHSALKPLYSRTFWTIQCAGSAHCPCTNWTMSGQAAQSWTRKRCPPSHQR